MGVRRSACVGILAALVALALAQSDAPVSAAPPSVQVDSAPRMPLPSEPQPETLSLARAIALTASIIVVGAVVGLVMFVKRRERWAPRALRPKAARRATARSHHPVLAGARAGPPADRV